MALSDAHLHTIEDNLTRLVKPTVGELRDILSELRASRTELRTMRRLMDATIRAHADLGDALQKAGEVR